LNSAVGSQFVQFESGCEPVRAKAEDTGEGTIDCKTKCVL
jgi:hypothetical protein